MAGNNSKGEKDARLRSALRENLKKRKAFSRKLDGEGQAPGVKLRASQPKGLKEAERSQTLKGQKDTNE